YSYVVNNPVRFRDPNGKSYVKAIVALAELIHFVYELYGELSNGEITQDQQQQQQLQQYYDMIDNLEQEIPQLEAQLNELIAQMELEQQLLEEMDNEKPCM
ncbi:MAG TPA: hypothetical protein VN328_02330, partial [Thermodesulfovibrionales bacterium]|nr:hypothetical protein [Thermodesulfovibrionales bacterium]